MQKRSPLVANLPVATSKAQRQLPQFPSPPPSVNASRQAPIQRAAAGAPPPPPPYNRGCAFCQSPLCNRGSICKVGEGLGDFFGPARLPDVSKAGKHDQVRKSHSKRKRFESEHMLPMQVTKNLFKRTRAGQEPTMSIPFGMHRGGQRGAGGGVTSTGSSATAKGWAKHLIALGRQAGGSAAAIRLAANDEYNAAIMQHADLGHTAHSISMVVRGQQNLGRITSAEADAIITMIMNRWLDEQKS